MGNDANGHSGSNDSKNNPHYRVALMNANGQATLGGPGDRGDASNVFPGTANKREFSVATNPTSRSYAGQDTFVAVKNISGPGRTMRMDISVSQVKLSKL
jgi:immune inhibitor A